MAAIPFLPFLFTPLLPFTPVAQAQQARCQWSTLRSATDLVLETLSAGGSSAPDSFLASPLLTYTQNSHRISVTSPESVLSPALAIAHAHSIIDQTACAAFVKLAVASNTTSTPISPSGPPAPLADDNAHAGTEGKKETATLRLRIMGMQIHYNSTPTPNRGATPTRLDLVFARQGQDWQMDDTADLLGYLQREDWGAISRTAQDSREVLEAVAGAYLDFAGGNGTGTGTVSGSNDSGAAAVPWGRPCARLEGSVYYSASGDGESCTKGLMVPKPGEEKGMEITERRFVMDESIGAVSVLAKDGRLGGAPSVFEFRVVGGKLRYVHQFAATGSVKRGG